MGHRRKARELAMQALFFMDMEQNDSDEIIELFSHNFEITGEIQPFFLKLVSGVKTNLSEIDALIEKFSSNWKLYRMSGVDRNVMRIAVFELLFCKDIPKKVTINEAIDIGKKFGSIESGAFINGVIDSIREFKEVS